MMLDKKTAYHALISRDHRFDGVFFVGVISTGIYCRPICPAKTPKQEHCHFFTTPALAEKASFRPCLRCRPELAPGNAPIDHAERITHLIVHRIEEGLDDDTNLETIAAQFELSPRQLRRIIKKELGVSLIELLQTRRLLLAKQLLTETQLPITEIAFASGFSSLRRFNDAFNKRYHMPPSRLRKIAPHAESLMVIDDTSTLQLTYRPPYDWEGILEFLAIRTIKEVECIINNSYLRTVKIGKHTGWISVTHQPDKLSLIVRFTHSLMPVLPTLLGRLRHLFDLNAHPDLISTYLLQDKWLKKSVQKNPGLRVPGAFDGFEMAIRAILGQQITVKAATTIAGRFAEAFGDKIATPFPELSRLSPTADQVNKASVDDIAKLGIISARAKCILHMSRAYMTKELLLEAGVDPEITIKKLITLPGIGQWTAHYIAMRALRWPDAFPKEDIVIRNKLGGVNAKEADVLSQKWRPWRSYAVLHIWRSPDFQI